MKNIALILASGTGSRCNLDIPKQFYKVKGKTILEYTVDVFQKHSKIDEIIIVTSSDYLSYLEDLFFNKYTKVSKIVTGGETRKDSSYNGISAIDEDNANILIHDGVRPFVSEKIISSCINALDSHDAVCVAVTSTDTVYITDENSCVKDIPNRNNVKRAQTPQCFKLDLIQKAHHLAMNEPNCIFTDDCGLVKHFNLSQIHLVDGDESNIKVTYPDDIKRFEAYLHY